MSNKYQGVKEYIDKCFENVLITKEVKEVKAELVFNLENKITDSLEKGMDFQTAYNKAVDSLGDMEELVSEFEKVSEIEEMGNSNRGYLQEEWIDTSKNGHSQSKSSSSTASGKQFENKFEDNSSDKYTYKYDYKYEYNYEYPKDEKSKTDNHFKPAAWVPLSVFLYVGIGLIFSGEWWWSIGWIIIPVTAILVGNKINYLKTGKKNHYIIVALMPFVYVGVGLIFNIDLWWSVAWIIIPVSAILVYGFSKKEEEQVSDKNKN